MREKSFFPLLSYLLRKKGKKKPQKKEENILLSYRDQLRQTARLEHRRHDDQVRSGIDQMRQRLVERKDKRGAVRLQPRSERVESALHLRVRRRTQEDKLGATVEGPPGRVLDQVHALLFGQPRDHSDDGPRVSVPAREIQPPSQRVPRRFLAFLCRLGGIRHR